MDQNSFYQTPFDFDFFPSRRFSLSLSLADPFEMISRRKESVISNLESPSARFKNQTHNDHQDTTLPDHSNFLLPSKPEDMHPELNNPNKLDQFSRNWQVAPGYGAVEPTLDPFFGMFDPYQICRSRAGSFNIGRFRKDSEDLFHSNPDFFRHIRNITDTRNSLESALQHTLSLSKYAKPFEKHAQNPQMLGSNSPKILMETPSSFADDSHGLTLNENVSDMGPAASQPKIESLLSENQTAALLAATRNTETTVDTNTEDDHQEKDGSKKRLLNNKTEAPVATKIVRKVGRPKKTDVERQKAEEANTDKTQKRPKQAKGSTNAKTEASSISEKSKPIEYAQVNKQDESRTKMSGMEELGQLRVPENLKKLIEGPNVPKEVQNFFRTSYSSYFEVKKIGTLTVEERKAKVEKYLEKRKKRSWCRRVNYDCRKRVADNRLRIKGRFVTRDQAFVLLSDAGISYDPEITNAEIKAILTEKLGASVLKKRLPGESGGDVPRSNNEKTCEDDEEENSECSE